MRKNFKMSFGVLLLAGMVAGSFSSCDNKDDTPEKTTFTLNAGTATGAQESPAVTTGATGTVSGTYDKNTHVLTYTASWTGLTGPATASHFHGPADPGVNAAVLVPITITNTAANGGTASFTATLPDSVATFFMNGKMYFNVHTATNKGGEIRTQVSLQ